MEEGTKVERSKTRIISFDVGTTNLGVCIIEYEENVKGIYPFIIVYWDKIKLDGKTVSECASSLNTILMSKYELFHDVDRVVIESQNVAVDTMKSLSHCIKCHYETLNILKEMGKYVDGLKRAYTIRWSCGDIKLRVWKGDVKWSPILKRKSKREMNKELGVKHTVALIEYMLDLNEEYKSEIMTYYEWFKKLRKQDDAADALLQGVYELFLMLDSTQRKKRKKRSPIVGIEHTKDPNECMIETTGIVVGPTVEKRKRKRKKKDDEIIDMTI